MSKSLSASVSRFRFFIVTTSISVLTLISVAVVFAAISLSTSTVYTQNFDVMGVPATATTTSTLPTDFRADALTAVNKVGEFSAAETTTARAGGANLATNAANGIYNFGSGTANLGGSDRAVGFLASGTGTASGNLYAQMVNSTGGDLSGLQISYNVEKYRNGTNAAGFRIQMFYSTDGIIWTSAGDNFLTPFDADANNNGFATAPGPVVKAVNNQTLSTSISNGSNFYLAWNYSVSSGSTTTNAQALAIDDISILGIQGSSPTPTNPTGVGAANPSPLLVGSQTLLTVTVMPGSNPASTGLSVSGNLSSIGGSATQQFFDDGTNGDLVADNNVFSYRATVSPATTPGAKTIPFSITDAQSRLGSGNISLTVRDPAEHMVMGNPSNAVSDANMKTNYLMLKTQYALSYNDGRGTPNWTSWHLDSTWQGSLTRPDVDFKIDPDLPPDFHRVRHADYTNTGFNRGHMCPSADRTKTDEENLATFLTTNIVPQSPDNNMGPWEEFEEYLRGFIPGSEIYIISGGSGIGGEGRKEDDTIVRANTIDNGNVTVPSATWKVALILPVGDNDVSRVDNNTRTIAVIMPNVVGIRSDRWQKYLKTVNEVEALTGYDFYSNVPAAVQDVLEAKRDPENEPGVLQFDAATYSMGESAGSATITVTRTSGNAGSASVNFATANGTATGGASCAAGADYINGSTTLSWAGGESGSKSFTVTICDDQVNEEGETISLALSNPTGSGILGALPAATLTIVNDDAPVLLTEENTEHAVALDSVTQTRDPFSLTNLHTLSMDQRRRVSLFVWRLGLQPGDTPSAVTVRAEDDQGRVYPLTVEYVGAVTDLSGVTQVVVVLPDAVVGAPRDLWVTVGLRGPASGRALIKIAAP
ncbi:MAG TPA: DNA/RNA non-specific endonuclease [Pyrinomonadaceae bacterium]|nr:DNA/RNA non-specific endonuclease [Pyrinomonadaceae bacterium]